MSIPMSPAVLFSFSCLKIGQAIDLHYRHADIRRQDAGERG